MNVLIVILCILAGYHLIYENVIIPNVVLKFKYRLSALQDELWRIKIIEKNKVDDKVFDISNEALETAIESIDKITLFEVVMFHSEMKKDNSLRQKIEERKNAVDNCQDERLQKLNAEGNKHFAYAVLMNSSGAIIYLLPVVLLVICIRSVINGNSREFRKIRELTLSPKKTARQDHHPAFSY